MTEHTEHDDHIHYESKPDGGLRIEGAGITIDIERESIARAEREGGLGLNVALTPEEHEAHTPPGIDPGESPIDSVTGFWFQIQPRDVNSADDPREDNDA